MTNYNNDCFERCPRLRELSDAETFRDCKGPNQLILNIPEYGALAVRACVNRPLGSLELNESSDLRALHVQRVINLVNGLRPLSDIDSVSEHGSHYRNSQYDVQLVHSDQGVIWDSLPDLQRNFWVFVRRTDEQIEIPRQDNVDRYEVRLNERGQTYYTVWSKENWLAENLDDYIIDSARLTPEKAQELAEILEQFSPGDEIFD